VPRARADRDALRSAADTIRSAERPLLVLGGGVRYSGAAAEAVAFAEAHGVPVVETVAGRTLVPHDHPLYGGALGIVGSASANTLAAESDVVVAVGTRLQDFTPRRGRASPPRCGWSR
jgi:3D-(3,5/4)-trihydroxycyclohexane-1,2-dione acylhydrolase (decyclizing)